MSEDKEHSKDRALSQSRQAVLWVCHTGDVRQRNKTEGCGHINITMMTSLNGKQAWCGGTIESNWAENKPSRKCNRRTRMHPMKCHIFDTHDEAHREQTRMYRARRGESE